MAERPDHPAICGATSPENMMPVGKDRVSSNRQHVLAGGSYAVVTEAANDLPQDKIKHWSRLKKAAGFSGRCVVYHLPGGFCYAKFFA